LEKSILEMARGAILERVDYEIPRIIENIRDPNTDSSKKRSITLTLTFKTDFSRENISLECDVKPPKLAPTNPVATNLYITTDEMGGVAVVELSPQIQGQLDLSGGVQEEPAKLRLIGGK